MPRRFVLLLLGVINPLIGFVEFESHGIGAAPQEENRAAKLILISRFDRAVHKRHLLVIEIEPGGILRLYDELVLTGVGGKHASLPQDCENVSVIFSRSRPLVAEIEVDKWIDSLDYFFFKFIVATSEVLSTESVRSVDRNGRVILSDQVGNRVPELLYRETREGDTRRPVSFLSDG